jgi:hypothetical protein
MIPFVALVLPYLLSVVIGLLVIIFLLSHSLGVIASAFIDNRTAGFIVKVLLFVVQAALANNVRHG